jgi:hypothetical protein
MTSRKKPGVAFWATVGLVGVAGYVLSIGPAAWFVNHNAGHEYLVTAYFIFYGPILVLSVFGPEPFRAALDWYLQFWS